MHVQHSGDIADLEELVVRTQVQLTETEARALRQLAVERSTSVAALIREGVAHVIRSRYAATPEEIRRRAIAIAGRFNSGLGDLARRHDDYFAEAIEATEE